MDTCGGIHGTIMIKAWVVIGKMDMKTEVRGYQKKEPSLICDIVTGSTKVDLPGNRSVLLIINNATFIEDDE